MFSPIDFTEESTLHRQDAERRSSIRSPRQLVILPAVSLASDILSELFSPGTAVWVLRFERPRRSGHPSREPESLRRLVLSCLSRAYPRSRVVRRFFFRFDTPSA